MNPQAVGGSHDEENLVTSCFDCNRGKSDSPLSDVPRPLREQAETQREAEWQLSEYKKFRRRVRSRVNKDIAAVADHFTELFPESSLSEQFKTVSVRRFLESFTADDLCDFLSQAKSRMEGKVCYDPDVTLKYFCGICWSKIKER